MLLPNLHELTEKNFTKITLKEPASFYLDSERVMVREIKNFRGKVMCQVESTSDKIMRPITDLPEYIQLYIDNHITNL